MTKRNDWKLYKARYYNRTPGQECAWLMHLERRRRNRGCKLIAWTPAERRRFDDNAKLSSRPRWEKGLGWGVTK